MATHDYVIANQGFPAFRTDLNNALAAIVSNNSNGSSPSTTYAYQMWYDTGTNIWKMRNSDNDAWINLATFNQTNDTVNFTDSSTTIAGISTSASATVLTLADGSVAINPAGFVSVGGAATQGGEIRFLEDTDAGSNYTALKAGTISSNVTFTLPIADGSSGQFLKTDGSGTLAFATASTGAAGSNTQVQYNNSGSFAGDADFVWSAGTGLIINSQKELRLTDADDSAYVGIKSHATVSGSYTLTMPAATGSANQILVTDGSGNLSFTDNSGGTAWAAVKTSNYTASAGEGVFANTTSGAFTVTLPASPSLGDEVSIVDYAGTFDTNNLTVGRNSQKIEGSAADLTVSIERAGFTLVFTDSTQGWLLKDK